MFLCYFSKYSLQVRRLSPSRPIIIGYFHSRMGIARTMRSGSSIWTFQSPWLYFYLGMGRFESKLLEFWRCPFRSMFWVFYEHVFIWNALTRYCVKWDWFVYHSLRTTSQLPRWRWVDGLRVRVAIKRPLVSWVMSAWGISPTFTTVLWKCSLGRETEIVYPCVGYRCRFYFYSSSLPVETTIS